MSEAQLTPNKLIEQLLTLPDIAAQQTLLKQHDSLLQSPSFSDKLTDLLKRQADHFLRIEVKRAEDLAAPHPLPFHINQQPHCIKH